MKRILSVITVVAFFLTSCTGPEGPAGYDGQDGVYLVGQSFETTIDFTSTNGYQESVEVPLDIDLYESDMVLVYHLRGQIDGYDVWKALPETIYVNATEEFQYNFEHNFDFVTIFIESHPTFDFNILTDDERINQTFRVVVLPIDLVNSSRIDINNYNDVIQYVK
ncbi:dihydrolipoamide dehydrogenase [Olleya sp. R77988]|uniref:dihydrolipoamide dehydrogenase n=1 Tax=Olleya sp. R77988 TaxID=3093875 RepID=UPI0037CA5B77